LNGLCEVTSVALAIWTGSIIARTRWRSNTMRANANTGHNRNSYYALTIRTLIFSFLLLVAFAYVVLSLLPTRQV
jgi:Mg2+/citrate symporter